MNNIALAGLMVLLTLVATVTLTVTGLKGKDKWWGWGLVAGAGFVFALARTTVIHTNWTYMRPLDGIWVVLFTILVLGTPALFALERFNAARVVAYSSLILAFVLPLDIFSPTFWSSWLMDGGWGWAAMLTLAFVLLIIVSRMFGTTAGIFVLAIYLLLSVASTLGTGSAPSGSITASASPTSTAGTTPSATPSVTATSATPSPSPTATETETTSTTKELRATEGSVITWKHATTLVDEQNATWFPQLINDNHEKLGFNWDNVKDWSKAKMADGNAVGARVIVVFDADKSDISDKAARKLVGIDSTKVDVQRATGCFTAVADNKETCPSGDQRVVVFLAPVVKVDGTIGLRAESGVALVASDGKVVLTPATYVAK